MMKSLHTQEYDHFRHLLVNARLASNRTQVEVAEKLGRPQSFVAKYEGGERRLDVVEFIRVCDALDVDPHFVIEEMQIKASS